MKTKSTAKKSSKKPPVNKLPEGMLGTVEVAEKFGITARHLRIVLRDSGKGSSGKRYAWKPGDKFLDTLPALIEEHAKREAAKK